MTGFQSKKASAVDKLTAQGTKKVIVRTLLTQELEVPEDWDRYEVFDFLAEHQSFRTAFQGVSNEDQTARIVDLAVVEEVVEQMGEEAFDE
jgi:23S rRNA G2445 N2-methylase RlmL